MKPIHPIPRLIDTSRNNTIRNEIRLPGALALALALSEHQPNLAALGAEGRRENSAVKCCQQEGAGKGGTTADPAGKKLRIG